MPTKLTIGLSKKFSTLGTDGRPDYGSIGADIHLEVELDSSIIRDAEAFAVVVSDHYKRAHHELEDEISRLRLSQPEPHAVVGPLVRDAEPAPTRSRSSSTSSSGNGYSHTDGNGTAATKPTFDWKRGGQAPANDRNADYPQANRSRPSGGGKSYGPPETGGQLYAWAKGHEERGALGFVKALQKFCKDQELPWKFNDLSPADVRLVHETGERMLADAGGY